MLRSTTSLWDYHLSATDGNLGKVKDLLFDDQLWIVRYLSVDSSAWLPGRRVLIVPTALHDPKWETHELPVALTREQVKQSPGIDADQPVSRQRELELHRHYGWVPYWPGPEAAPMIAENASKDAAATAVKTQAGRDVHLRSVDEVTGYGISARDGDVGHVEDFIVDDQGWHVRYIVVDTRNWLPGKKVIVPPEWSKKIDWGSRKVEVDLTRDEIEGSPEYDPNTPVNRRYETQLYDYYGRPKYWI